MLAISCKKNEATDPGTFSVSQASGNVLTAIVQTNGTTFKSEVKILFSSDKSFSAALTSATTNGVDAMGELSYDANTGKITFPDAVITNGSLTNGKGENITYSLSFTVNADDTSLRNPSQTFNIDAVLKGTTLVTKENIKACFTDFAIKDSESSSKHSFNLNGNSGSTYSDSEATFIDSDNGGGNFSINAFTSNSVFSDALGSEKLGKYFDNPAYGTPTGNGEQTLTLPLTLNPKPEYEWSATTYNLKFTLKQSSDKWAD